ncbi:heparinase II/III family protein [Zoogloea sp.]|uniref:heparinase II/III family protein n=1 Tax=Zoogloea sp. TaxID=49181 RepID=UPI0035AEB4EB
MVKLISRVRLLGSTAIHLKSTQIAFRLYYKFFRRVVIRYASRPVSVVGLTNLDREAVFPVWSGRARVGDACYEFLGVKGCVNTAGDWNASGYDKLWLYNLHYFDDLNGLGADECVDGDARMVQRWIAENPVMVGNGWEPYPLSLRIVNWLKWFVGRREPSREWLENLARQVNALYFQREYHILANHLFVNGKALVFAAALLDSPESKRWMGAGLAILDHEVAEQFLDDGGHFELSPMYHASLLWDLCDLLYLAKVTTNEALLSRWSVWSEVLARGVAWLESMTHPDGLVSFFNDSAYGIAPTLCDIQSYLELLGIGALDPGSTSSVRALTDSGYIVVPIDQGGKAILDVGEIGPSYQPGHGHADVLSFELSLFGSRLLVNSGTSVYGESVERVRQRGSAAHNTVVINGRNSSEVWGGFRVGRRAHPIDVRMSVDFDDVVVTAGHDGYRRLRGRPNHTRTFKFSRGHLLIRDELRGEPETAVAYFHLHPDVRIAECGMLVTAGGDSIGYKVNGGDVQVISSTWHPRFGEVQVSQCLEVTFSGKLLEVEFVWGDNAYSFSH